MDHRFPSLLITNYEFPIPIQVHFATAAEAKESNPRKAIIDVARLGLSCTASALRAVKR